MRTWIANRLVRLARWIQPENEEVMKFWTDRMLEVVITGKSNILISHVDVTPEPRGDPHV